MSTTDRSSLIRLKDTDKTIAAPGDDIRGHRVLDKDGKELGKIDALLIDEEDQKVRFVEVATGGFLGLGKEKSLIPIDAITDIDKHTVHLNQTSDTVAGSPAYDPNLVEKDTGLFENTYGYYGLMPYWGLGYAYPVWPQRSAEEPLRP